MSNTAIEIPFKIQDQKEYGRTKEPYTMQTDILKILQKLGDGTLHRYPITDPIAADLLYLNTDNRKFKPVDIKRYALDMFEGNWYWTGEPLIITDKWRFADGQKRLWAFRAANERLVELGRRPLELEFNITVGVSDKYRAYLDIGINRTAADVLRDHGYTDVNVLGATVKGVYYLKEFHRVGSTMQRGMKMDNPRLITWLRDKGRRQRITEIISKTRMFYGNGLYMTLTSFATLWYIFDEIDEGLADNFMKKLASGEDLHMDRIIDCNITYLRQHLDRIVKRSYTDPSYSKTDIKPKYIVRAWNACRDKTRLEKNFKIDSDKVEIETPY